MLIVRPEAETDIADVGGWYEDQVPGLRGEFLKALDETIQSIEQNPGLYARVHGELRRALTPRFPYGVFYLARTERIVVFAVLHTARDPRIWKRRARARGKPALR
jgi:plasmid stabilization system protein ParE